MRECALSFGAELRPCSQITSIMVPETTRPSVRIEYGEVIQADVIIGADGSNSIVRREMLGQELRGTSLGLTVFK